ncbi:hypothetical protein KGF54_001528 [Candida jiufengensis]|uniref:uncharacterized protein n=1 Tax=Candida jiufengensis TaxID=497108 RepID=UPI0022250A35|nr:uncharacterized protein KGF54_001528 [Candida jiufengensis]KAI5954967.1 hypothetical protein KGF54_001528 [Candida jiufengensis]
MIPKPLMLSSKANLNQPNIIRQFTSLLGKDISKLNLNDLQQDSLKKEQDENKDQYENSRIKLINSLIGSSNPNKKQLLQKLIPNFSTFFKYTSMFSKIENELLLNHFIQLNPERVISNQEILEIYLLPLEDSEIKQQILNKLIEKFGQNEDQEFSSIDFIIEFMNKHNLSELIEFNVINSLFQTLLKNGNVEELIKFTDKINTSHEMMFKILTNNSINDNALLGKFLFLRYIDKVFKFDSKSISNINYTIALYIINYDMIEVTKSFEKHLSDDLNKLGTALINHINESKIDIEPKNLPLRKLIIENFGIVQQDTKKLLSKYHEYESKASYGIQIVLLSVVKSFAYLSILNNSEIDKKIAETLQPSTITVHLLQILIIMKSYFNIEDGLNLYNQYINELSNKVNELGFSQRGLITKSIILGFLINNDKNFAWLIFEKSIEKGILADELEISNIKKLFKQYSDCFDVANEKWENEAELKMKNIVLEYVKDIGKLDLKYLIE